MSAKIPATGAALAAMGLSHFAKPQIFDKITAPAFPNDTRRHVYTNGTIETALGVGMMVPQTRRTFCVCWVSRHLPATLLMKSRTCIACRV